MSGGYGSNDSGAWPGSDSWGSDYSSDWYGSGKGGKKGKYGKGRKSEYRGGKGQLENSVKSLSYMMECQAWESWEKTKKEKEAAEEEKKRKMKEEEAEERKKEREAFLEEYRKEVKESNRVRNRSRSPPPARVSGSASAIVISPSGGEGFEGYREALKKKTAKAQTVRAPCEVDEWRGWTCSAAAVKKVKAEFPNCCPDSEMIGEGLFEVAEAVANGTSPSKSELATQFQVLTSEEAPSRWARVDIIVGILAHKLS